jgi:hypothetical protein
VNGWARERPPIDLPNADVHSIIATKRIEVGDCRSDVEWRLFVCDIRNVYVHARIDTSKIFNEGAKKTIFHPRSQTAAAL